MKPMNYCHGCYHEDCYLCEQHGVHVPIQYTPECSYCVRNPVRDVKRTQRDNFITEKDFRLGMLKIRKLRWTQRFDAREKVKFT
jgi:hypothetical protein